VARRVQLILWRCKDTNRPCSEADSTGSPRVRPKALSIIATTICDVRALLEGRRRRVQNIRNGGYRAQEAECEHAE
jgi:hypothetical protein